MTIKTIQWVGDINGYAEMVDQTLLPGRLEYLKVTDPQTMWRAIKTLQVRGAPAIGIAGAMGLVLGVQKLPDSTPLGETRAQIAQIADYLAGSRPTAVNLFWALDRLRRAAENSVTDTPNLKKTLLAEAQAIRDEDAAMCRQIGAVGARLIPEDAGVLTHCNAGGLATADYGTALAVMFTAHEQGRKFRVFADETRPLLQGARLTAWELMQAGIDVTLICDNMAAHLMSRAKIDLIITGADRIAANGDSANKIGTYGLAVLAAAHDIPFYVAAPSSTFDLKIPDGSHIPIEERAPEEVTSLGGVPVAPVGVPVYNPAFDVTPARLIRAIITEKSLIEPPFDQNIAKLLR